MSRKKPRQEISKKDLSTKYFTLDTSGRNRFGFTVIWRSTENKQVFLTFGHGYLGDLIENNTRLKEIYLIQQRKDYPKKSVFEYKIKDRITLRQLLKILNNSVKDLLVEARLDGL